MNGDIHIFPLNASMAWRDNFTFSLCVLAHLGESSSLLVYARKHVHTHTVFRNNVTRCATIFEETDILGS